VIGDLAYDALACGVALFIWWRLVWSLRHQKTDFKGVVALRGERPRLYWFGIGMLIVGAAITSFVALAFVSVTLSHLQATS
jgi:hypothetical protein